MPPSPAHVQGVQPASCIHRGRAHDDGPLELIRAREDNGRRVGEELEQVLEARFHRREGAARDLVDFLI